MRRGAPVPPALVRATIAFEASTLRSRWRRHQVASPGSILEIGFRLVNLYAAAFAPRSNGDGIPSVCGGVDGEGGAGGPHDFGRAHDGEDARLVRAQDAEGVRAAALGIEADLVSWREGAPRGWRFSVVRAAAAPPRPTSVSDGGGGGGDEDGWFGGERHEYQSLWIAEAWNNWRALRLVLNQVIVRNEARAREPDARLRAAAEGVVREMSAELCVSVANFAGTPRTSPPHPFLFFSIAN
jgi:hypothetical protein